MRRREFIHLLGLSASVISLSGMLPMAFREKRLVRPPGSLSESAFIALCTRCGRCVQACPTCALVFSSGSDGFTKIGTPKVDALVGPCERIQGRCEKQAQCAQACPTAAIQRTSQRDLKIGSAVIDLNRCIAWNGGFCLVCYEVCPVRGAISLIDDSRPSFNEETCVGCGRCAYACPAQPKALSIDSKGERRL